MPSPVLNCVPGEISRMVSAPGAEMRAHHPGVALEAAAGENDGVRRNRRAAGSSASPLTPPASRDEPRAAQP